MKLLIVPTSWRAVCCALGLIAPLALAGCTTPSSGPAGASIQTDASTVIAPAAGASPRYALVDVGARVSARLPEPEAASFFRTFGGLARQSGPSSIPVGIGDTIQITIFESAKGGLFIPEDAGARPGNFVTLPPQLVDRTGAVKVPYAGQINVAGRFVRDIQTEIESRLRQKAIEPQAVINIVTSRASEVAVLGEVNGANKFPINLGGDRVLDVVSRAGGIRNPGFETYLTLQRAGRSQTVYFPQLIRNPRENVFVRPGDTVLVSRDQRAFSVFGAVLQNGRYPFDREAITLAEAIARGGGLADARANPSHVYLYRIEPRAVLERLGAPLANFPVHQRDIPTIYQADLKDPAGFFSTQQFQVRNNDVIFVGNADTVEVIKFFDTLTAITAPLSQGASAGFNIRRVVQP